MFGFDKPEDGSEDRFRERAQIWKKRKFRWMHLVWWWIHNCVSHPLIGFMPIRFLFRFHDWTSHKLNPEPLKGTVAERAKFQATLDRLEALTHGVPEPKPLPEVKFSAEFFRELSEED